jgi:hypothetical protein
MKAAGGILLCFLGVGSVLCVGQTRYKPPFRTLSVSERTHILDGQFTFQKDVTQLPTSLKLQISRLAGEKDFRMANPGEEYQSTDVILRPGLPRRRLLFAGISKDKIFILYESGGYSHRYYLAVFHLDPKRKVTFLWMGTGTQGAASLRQLRMMVAAGEFADNRAYSW